MTETEWLACTDTNELFAAIEQPSEEQANSFNLACCRRIRSFITDDSTIIALDCLEEGPLYAAIPTAVALGAIRVGEASEYFNVSSRACDPSRNFAAMKAVAHAVCRSLPANSSHYWNDILDNARLVALNCQWAVANDATATSSEECRRPNEPDSEPGRDWLSKLAREAEAAVQCELIRQIFRRRESSESSSTE